MSTIRRALWVSLSGMALISAPRAAWAAPPPSDTAASAAPSAPSVPAPSAPPAASLRAPGLSPAPEFSVPSNKSWYGWQTWLVFGGSSLLMAASATRAVAVTTPLSLGGFTLGGPIVHWAHGNVSKGFMSLGLNIGGLALGYALGAGMACAVRCEERLFTVPGLGPVIGSGVGLLTASIIDATVLAYGPPEPPRESARAGQRRSLALLPTLDIGKGRASLGLAGTF